ncbi:MAG: insulinase family protein [Chloroflexi bacterium]|nr:MAG: insulinase family protein [Chloroflexota bacterium]
MEYQKTVLPNNLRVLSSPMPHTRSVSIAFYMGVGSRYEAESEGGASHFIEHLLFKGTRKWPTALHIASAVEGVGGLINGSTGQEVTVYWAKLAKPHWKLGFEILSDMLLNPLFREEDVEKERHVILEEMNMLMDSPEDWVYIMAIHLLWPGHPLGREIIGTRESLSNLTRQHLINYMRRHYIPSQAVISVAGDISHQEVLDAVSEYLEEWVDGRAFSYLPAPNHSDGPSQDYQKRQTEQVHMVLNWRGLPLNHPDRFALRVMNAILGEGMSSRLFTEIREKRGLAYRIHSYLEFFQDTGAMGISAGIAPSRFDEALCAIAEQLARLKEQEVPEEELRKAKEFIKGRLLLQLEDSFSVAAWLGRQELLLGHILSVDEVIEAIEAVTPQDVRRLACELLKPSNFNLAVIGPFGEEKDWVKVFNL